MRPATGKQAARALKRAGFQLRHRDGDRLTFCKGGYRVTVSHQTKDKYHYVRGVIRKAK